MHNTGGTKLERRPAPRVIPKARVRTGQAVDVQLFKARRPDGVSLKEYAKRTVFGQAWLNRKRAAR